jgi:hypothetical protein
MLISSVSSFSPFRLQPPERRKIIETRMIEEDIQKELEAVTVSIVFINPLFGIIRFFNLCIRQCGINENC